MQVLILDEPINQLNVTSAWVMDRAVNHTPGSVIVVSHDRFFIDKVAIRTDLFSIEGLSCGYDYGEAMSHGYQAPFTYTGRKHHVTIVLSGKLIKDG